MMLNQNRTFRQYGPLGALLDEYEKAIEELIETTHEIADDSFRLVIDAETSDPDCVSYQSVLNHVLNAGYGYIGYILDIYDEAFDRPKLHLESVAPVKDALHKLFKSTEECVLSKKDVPLDDALWNKTIVTRWNAIYNFEQIMEHAIVHVLRHRRQIEKFLQRERGAKKLSQ